MLKKPFILLLSVLLFIKAGHTQEDSLRNTIKLNFAPQLIIDTRNINIGYERQLGDNRALQLNAGYYTVFGGLFSSISDFDYVTDSKNYGFIVSGNYRFYWSSRNTHPKPDGLYWAPFFFYTHLHADQTYQVFNNDILQGTAQLTGTINIGAAGVALGYQFLLGQRKRWGIDLTMLGLGFGRYHYNLHLKSDLNVSDEVDLTEDVKEMLREAFPNFNKLFSNSDVGLEGTNASYGIGLQFQVQLGYRF